MDNIISHLNEKQKEAVLTNGKPLLILAGAGSGKTRVIISKVAYAVLELGIDPKSVLMITFTNKAAQEMKERIARLNDNKINLGFAGTFHSFCAYILRRFGNHIGLDQNFSIYDTDDQVNLIKKILKEEKIEKNKPNYFLSKISLAKNMMVGPSDFLEKFDYYGGNDILKVYRAYQNALEKQMAVDFDDLLMKTVFLFRNNPEVLNKCQNQYGMILIDEFQDTNHAQYEISYLLSKNHKNITVVGDFSQSIYSWRGADIGNLSKFKLDFPEAITIELDENYRSTQSILDLAHNIIKKNENSHPVLYLKTVKNIGKPVIFKENQNETIEAFYIINEIKKQYDKGVKYEDMAILYRMNAQSRILEEGFLKSGIGYHLIGGTRFYDRKEIKDILSYIRLLANPYDKSAEERALKVGKRRFAKFVNFLVIHPDIQETHTAQEVISAVINTTGYVEKFDKNDAEERDRIENINELLSVAVSFPTLTEFLHQIALVETGYAIGGKNEEKTGVKLMTLHQAKGLEFDCVFVAGVEDGLLPHNMCQDDQAKVEEERRLLYVGVTRARKLLYITYTKKRMIFGTYNYAYPSEFIAEYIDVKGKNDFDYVDECYDDDY